MLSATAGLKTVAQLPRVKKGRGTLEAVRSTECRSTRHSKAAIPWQDGVVFYFMAFFAPRSISTFAYFGVHRPSEILQIVQWQRMNL
jgi:hypothetical protein